MKSLKLNSILCFLFFIFSTTVKGYAQCSIDKILLFNFGENSLTVLSNIYSNENLRLKENYSYEALNNVKDETKGKFLRHIVIEINNSDCFKDDLLKQTCHLRFINDISSPLEINGKKLYPCR